MNFQEVTEQARGNIGPYCKACNVCNGAACKNQMPGPGAKGLGKVAMRNYEKWQEICVNMDTICEQKPVNTKVELFGRTFDYPVFAGPVGAVKLHYGEQFEENEYNQYLPVPRMGLLLSPEMELIQQSWKRRRKQSAM